MVSFRDPVLQKIHYEFHRLHRMEDVILEYVYNNHDEAIVQELYDELTEKQVFDEFPVYLVTENPEEHIRGNRTVVEENGLKIIQNKIE